MNKALTVNCPHCETTFSYYESEYRPFCSKRCQQIDLGRWFQESYVVPTKEVATEENQPNEEHEENNESEYEN